MHSHVGCLNDDLLVGGGTWVVRKDNCLNDVSVCGLKILMGKGL